MLDRCRLCGSDDVRPWMTDGRNQDLIYYKCGKCTLWNYDLAQGLDQMQYTEEYINPLDTEHKANVDIRQSWDFLNSQLPVPGSIMDVGCGNAGLLHLAREANWQVTGMELSAPAAQAIRENQNIDVIVGDFLEYENTEGRQYDVVVLRHVLEHLPDSILAMKRIGSLLKNNGVALLEFPNTQSFAYAIKRVLKNRGLRNKKYSADWRPGHTNEFCRKSFEYLLGKTDFELLVWRTYSSKPAANIFYRLVPYGSKARVLVRKKRTP